MSKSGGGSGRGGAGSSKGGTTSSSRAGGAGSDSAAATAPKQSSLEQAFSEAKNVADVLDMRQLAMLAKEKGVTPDDKRSKQSYIDALKKVIKPATKELSAEDKALQSIFDKRAKNAEKAKAKRVEKKSG